MPSNFMNKKLKNGIYEQLREQHTNIGEKPSIQDRLVPLPESLTCLMDLHEGKIRFCLFHKSTPDPIYCSELTRTSINTEELEKEIEHHRKNPNTIAGELHKFREMYEKKHEQKPAVMHTEKSDSPVATTHLLFMQDPNNASSIKSIQIQVSTPAQTNPEHKETICSTLPIEIHPEHGKKIYKLIVKHQETENRSLQHLTDQVLANHPNAHQANDDELRKIIEKTMSKIENNND
jgi:hypothetical protein